MSYPINRLSSIEPIMNGVEINSLIFKFVMNNFQSLIITGLTEDLMILIKNHEPAVFWRLFDNYSDQNDKECLLRVCKLQTCLFTMIRPYKMIFFCFTNCSYSYLFYVTQLNLCNSYLHVSYYKRSFHSLQIFKCRRNIIFDFVSCSILPIQYYLFTMWRENPLPFIMEKKTLWSEPKQFVWPFQSDHGTLVW